MYLKQIRIMNRNCVESLLFTTASNGTPHKAHHTLCEVTATQARSMAESKPTKIPPYNAYNPTTMDIVVKNEGIGSKIRALLGASSTKAVKQMEQRVGYVDISELAIGLPVLSCVCLNVNKQTGEQLVEGKFISTLDGRRYMYAILHRLSELQQETGTKTYLGMINGRATSQDLKYECVCEFAISPEALDKLGEEEFGFLINTRAMKEYDYTIDDIVGNDVPQTEVQKFADKCKAHNQRVMQALKK